MSIATKTGEWSKLQRSRSTSRKPRRSGLSTAARDTLRQNASNAERAASAPPLAWPSTSTAAFIAPADVPEMPSICSHGSSSRRSRAPQVKAPCAPPPCSARSIRIDSRFDVSALLVATGVVFLDQYGRGASRSTPPCQYHEVGYMAIAVGRRPLGAGAISGPQFDAVAVSKLGIDIRIANPAVERREGRSRPTKSSCPAAARHRQEGGRHR